MKTSTKIAAVALSAAALTAGGATAAFAGSSDIPVPSDSASVAPDTFTRTTPPPVVTPNLFRNCRFTLTQEVTFAPQLGRFVRENVPSITCWSRARGVQVYTLSGPGAF